MSKVVSFSGVTNKKEIDIMKTIVCFAKYLALLFLISNMFGCQNIGKIKQTDGHVNAKEVSKSIKSIRQPTSTELLDYGNAMMDQKRYNEAEEYFIRSAKMGNAEADVLLAMYSLIGTLSHYSYSDAKLIIERNKGKNIYASRAYALLWVSDIANPAHKTSKVNAYFAIRDYMKFDPGSDFYKLLPEANEFSRLISDANGAGWVFDPRKDPMTDVMACYLRGYEQDGVSLSMDSTGIYIWSKKPLSNDFSHMGLRIDSGRFYSAYQTDSYKSWQERRKALISLSGMNGMTIEATRSYMAKIDSEYKPSNYVYVSKKGDDRFEDILKSLALGEQFRIRVKFTDNTDSVQSYSLMERMDELDKSINLFDIFGYVYVACINGELH